jgi:hypothetical protein
LLGTRPPLIFAHERTDLFRLFIGNFFLHQKTWGVIGLWYPKRQAQQRLF